MTTETRPNITIFDCVTQTQETRPMNDEEWESHKAISERSQAEQAERDAQKEAFNSLRLSAKQKLIAGEPLSEEEAAVIIL